MGQILWLSIVLSLIYGEEDQLLIFCCLVKLTKLDTL